MSLKTTPIQSAPSKTNIYLRSAIKAKGKRIARERYGISLSVLVNQLINLECETKRGLLRPEIPQQ